MLLYFSIWNTRLYPLQQVCHAITMLRRNIQWYYWLTSKRVNLCLRILKLSVKIAKHIAFKPILALIRNEDDRRNLGRKVDAVICPTNFLSYILISFLFVELFLRSALLTASAIE
jgi:hypothetical protein